VRHRVHLALELNGLGIRNPRLLRMDILGQCRKNRAEVEELMLNPQEDCREHGDAGLARRNLFDRRACRSGERVEFIHSAVRLDPGGVLRYALSTRKGRIAAVALPRIYAVDGDARIVKSIFTHG
jgi:hypothetical protein